MESLNQALKLARTSYKLHSLLDKFFVEQTTKTIECLKECASSELQDYRAYLLAIGKLEQELLEYTNKYNLIEARRRHARSSS